MSRLTISVALATYNGERFLQEQLNSLAAQTLLPCELVVGDDGSTDGTLDILERFAKTAPFPVRIQCNPTNIGYGQNFLQTATRCRGHWIAFCDQDDVWDYNKLSSLWRIARRHPEISLLVHEFADCDERLREHVSRVPGFCVSRSVPPLKGGFRIFAGCSMVFRRSLLRVIDAPHDADCLDMATMIGHDSLVSLLSYCAGGRYELRKTLVLHRRHTAALTNGYSNHYVDRLKRVRSTAHDSFQQSSAMFLSLEHWLRDHAAFTREPHRSAFLTAARLLNARASLYRRRGELYAACEITKRTRKFGRLITRTDYWKELSTRDHVKDFLRLLLS